MATRSPETIRFAAKNQLPLQHYFAAPVDQRLEIERIYADAAPAADPVAHLHALIVVIDDDEAMTRRDLAERLTESFIAGDWPSLPQGSASGHADSAGRPSDRAAMARRVADAAIIGDKHSVAAQIAAFEQLTGATRLAFYVEAIADPERIRATITGLAEMLLRADERANA